MSISLFENDLLNRLPYRQVNIQPGRVSNRMVNSTPGKGPKGATYSGLSTLYGPLGETTVSFSNRLRGTGVLCSGMPGAYWSGTVVYFTAEYPKQKLSIRRFIYSSTLMSDKN